MVGFIILEALPSEEYGSLGFVSRIIIDMTLLNMGIMM